MQDKSEKASPVNTKNGFVRNTLQTSTRKIYRNRKKPERKTQREGPKKTRFFRPDLPIRPITGFFRKNSGVEKSRNLPRPPLSEKRHRPTPSEHRNIIRKSKCSTDFKRNDFLKKTKRTHWVRFVHLNSLIESCVFLYLWNSPFDTFL